MTGIAKFYNKFLSFIELDPTRPIHICKFSDPVRPDPTRPDPTRGSTRPACNSAAATGNARSPRVDWRVDGTSSVDRTKTTTSDDLWCRPQAVCQIRWCCAMHTVICQNTQPYHSKRGQRILTTGCIAGRRIFQCNVTSAATFVLILLLIFCSEDHRSDRQYLSVGQTNPKNCPFPSGIWSFI